MDSKSSSLESFIREKREDYKTWKPMYSPALQEYVSFNAKGFNHLNFKINNIARNPKEAMYKVGLLPLVRAVIHTAEKVEKYEKRFARVGGTKERRFKEIEYCAVRAIVGKENTDVKVILRRVGKGKIHFWSVMKV